MFKKIAALAVTFACVFSFMASATFLDDNNFFYNFKAQTVKTQTLGDVGYDLQGNVVSTLSLPNPEVKTTDRLSANGNAANRAFRACYDMNFFQE